MTWCSSSLVRDWYDLRAAHDDFAPSQTAQPMSAASPTIQATRPSLTGPMKPRLKPPGRGLLLRRLEVGDDVPLVLRGDRLVVEDRHRLRAGEHGLEDVRAASCRRGSARTCRGSARRPCRRSCGTSRSWSGRSRPPRRRVALGRVDLFRRRDRPGPGPRTADVGGELADLLLGEPDLACGACGPVACSGMRPVPTWKSTDAGPTPMRLGALLRPAASSPWQLAQLARNRARPLAMSSVRVVGGVARARGERRVEDAGHDQPEEDQDDAGEGMTPAGGESSHDRSARDGGSAAASGIT